jgi:hypothetical protein
MEEISGFENPTIDLPMKCVVQSLDPAREFSWWMTVLTGLPDAVVHDANQPEYLMRGRTPRLLSFHFDGNLAVRCPAIGKTMEMLLG